MPIEIIAEIANAHQGDSEIALKLAKASAGASADAVKFQIFFAEEFLTKNHPRFKHFREISFSGKTWDLLLQKSKKLGIKVYADVFGLKALEAALRNDIDGLKIHSSDLTNTALLNKIAYYNKKVFLATGGSTILEIRYALDHINQFQRPSEIILLHGFQAYPTKKEDSNLSRIKKLKELFGDIAEIGYSDHTAAEDAFTTAVPLMAIPYDISCIEKHITFDRKAKGIDYHSSLEPGEFENFINDIRTAEQAIGTDVLKFSEAEKNYRKSVKKMWVAAKELNVKKAIGESDIIMKRGQKFIASTLSEEILGKRLLRPLKKEEALKGLNLEHKTLAIIVARSRSRRLPDKALLDINAKPALSHLFERVKICKERGFVHTVAFCTTAEPEDDKLVDIARKYPFKIYRGSIENVLSRMMLAIDDNNDHDVVVRITGDDLLIDFDYLKKTIDYHLKTNAHYTDAKKLPNGVEVEVFDAYVLKLMNEFLKDSSGSEYLTNYIKNNQDQFKVSSFPVPQKHAKHYRLTLDTKEDYLLIKRLLEYFKEIGKEYSYTLNDIISFFEENPEALEINKRIRQPSKETPLNTEIEWQAFTKQPLVTAYITNHNYGCFIKRAIDSALNQKFRDFELIIIDDGSSDNSREIIEKYRHHPKIKIIFQQNKGLNVSNNIALKLSRGKYIMRLDADDYLDENALLVMANKMERDSNLALVFPDYYLIDEKGNTLAHERRHNFEDITLMDQAAHGACTMIKKDCLLEIGGYSEDISCQDGYEVWIKFIKRFKVANINLPLFYYRQHDRSITKDQDKIVLTRHEIIKKNVNEKEIKQKKHICIVPVRGGEEVVPLAIRKFSETTLLDITINTILKSENISKIILTTPDERIIQYAEATYGKEILIDKRPEETAGINKKLEDAVDYIIATYGSLLGKIDTITVVTFEFPLRKHIYIDKAINTLYLFDVDSVISIKQRNANFYRHHGHGLVPFDTNRELRLERDFIYEETGGIHTVRFNSYKKMHSINAGKVSHIIIDEISSKKVENETEFELLSYLYSKMNNVK